jgi:hypothetical protein
VRITPIPTFQVGFAGCDRIQGPVEVSTALVARLGRAFVTW